jgi:hypothetical protein
VTGLTTPRHNLGALLAKAVKYFLSPALLVGNHHQPIFHVLARTANVDRAVGLSHVHFRRCYHNLHDNINIKLTSNTAASGRNSTCNSRPA